MGVRICCVEVLFVTSEYIVNGQPENTDDYSCSGITGRPGQALDVMSDGIRIFGHTVIP